MPDEAVRIQVRSPETLLAVVPSLLGFHPERSLVLLGMSGPRGRCRLAFRYDLPDPPDQLAATEIIAHAIAVLHREHLTTAVVIGYGPGTLVTPVTDLARHALQSEEIRLHDMLRVEQGRYWSYLCPGTACCPPSGSPVPGRDHPATLTLALAGLTVAGNRAARAATLAPALSDTDLAEAARQAELTATGEAVSLGPEAARNLARRLVEYAITAYRDGQPLTSPAELADLAVALTDIEVRDDAWARMQPEHHAAHMRLWTDVTRHAAPGYAAPPASLLSFTAWQSGDGALAAIAIERALADNPSYSMALLILDALTAGLPPSAAVLPMTPEEVADSYDQRRRRHRS